MEKWIIQLLLILGLGLGLGPVDWSVAEEVAGDGPVEVSVDINSADAETLAVALEGIGYAKAEAIVRYREQYGRFYSAEELTAVKGIGRSTVEKNRTRITLQ
jgi:competence protein ComEA